MRTKSKSKAPISIVQDGILLSDQMDSMKDWKKWQTALKKSKKLSNQISQMFEGPPTRRKHPLSKATKKLIEAFAEFLGELSYNYDVVEERQTAGYKQTKRPVDLVAKKKKKISAKYKTPQPITRREDGNSRSKSK